MGRGRMAEYSKNANPFLESLNFLLLDHFGFKKNSHDIELIFLGRRNSF